MIIAPCWKQSRPYFSAQTRRLITPLSYCSRVDACSRRTERLDCSSPAFLRFLSRHPCLPADSSIIPFCLGPSQCLIPARLVALSLSCSSAWGGKKTKTTKIQRADHKRGLFSKHAHHIVPNLPVVNFKWTKQLFLHIQERELF